MEVAAIWAAVGPLAGVIVGAWLTGWRQNRHWILDNKKAEYREILDSLKRYRWRLLNYRASVSGIGAYDPKERHEEARAFAEVEASLSNALADRLFVRRALGKSSVREEFEEFVRSMHTNEEPSITEIIRVLSHLHDTVVQIAEVDLGLRGWFRR